jgi:hypothetical protein
MTDFNVYRGDDPFATLVDRIPNVAWPGAYDLYYMDGEDNVLCPKCAREAERIYRDGVLGDMCDWCLTGKLPWEVLELEGYGTGVDCDGRPYSECAFLNNWSWENKLRPQHQAVHWEGEPLVCDECNVEIESAYGAIVEG